MKVVVTRPAADISRLAVPLVKRGVTVIEAPMLEIAPVDSSLCLDGLFGYVVTSANGARALATRLSADHKALPMWTVGPRTARVARQLGFRDVTSANGDVAALTALILGKVDPAAGVLLYAVAKTAHGALGKRLTAGGFSLRKVVLYETRPITAMPLTLITALRACEVAGTFFLSPRTAETFHRLAHKQNVSQYLTDATAWCLSPAVAAALAQLPFRKRLAAVTPTQDALLATFDAWRAHSRGGDKT